MDDFANPGLLNLQAMFIDTNDSHAKPGAHIRVSHHPLLGLPAMPFVLERAEVYVQEVDRLNFREDAVWQDKNGQPLVPPFSMDDGDEVTVTLPTGTGNMAIWAEILADPSSNQVPNRFQSVVPGRPTRPNFGGDTGPLLGGEFSGGALRDLVMNRSPNFTGIRTDFELPKVFTSAMRVQAFVRSVATGSKSLGTRSEPPFAFSAPGLVKFIIRGRGTVVGIRWLDGDETQKGLKWEVLDVLNLPHKGGLRYLSLSNWQSLCDNRLARQFPNRRPMQDVTGAVSRNGAPFHSAADEFDRVFTLFDGLEKPLDELISGPAPQHQQITRHTLTREDGTAILPDASAEASIPSLGLVFQGQIDPGVASWMGYKTLDLENVGDPEHRLSFYRVRGYFRNPTDDVLVQNGIFFTLLVQAARRTLGLVSSDNLMGGFASLAEGWLRKQQVEITSDMTPFTGMRMGAMAIADYMAPLDDLAPPVLETPRHVSWLSSPTASPRRSTETNVRGMPAGSALAVQMRQPQNTGSWRRLNRELDIGQGNWRTLLVASMVEQGDDAPSLPTGVQPPDTVIADNKTGPDTLSLHAALMDRMGRYSEWAVSLGDAGPRPKPPRPVLIGSYQQPKTSTGLREGKITAVVPLPEERALAPGSHPLSHAEITVQVDGLAFGPTLSLPITAAVSIHPNNNIPGEAVPADQDSRGVRITIDGPTIPATQSRALRMTAVWKDITGQTSAVSEPVALTMTDPYPPAQISIPDVLDYAARPDATGVAWVERDIPGASSGVNYAVYYADENRLRDHLRRSAGAPDSALLAQLEAEPNPAARATALRAAQTRFPGHLFERLEGVIETTPTLRFRHSLPGTLRVLSAYKIAVESAANAAGPNLSALDTIFYGVPNSDPPPRPSVSVKLIAPEGIEPDLVALVTVTLRAGLTPGSLARVRRTRSGVIDPIRNPVIGTAVFGPIDPATGLQTATLRDIGSAQIAPAARLMAFINYAWIAEAQGSEEPGSMSAASGAVPGLWSQASAPATLTLVPETLPIAPIFANSSSQFVPGGLTNVELEFGYPLNLTPGSPGPWHIRVERARPDEGLELVSENPAPAGTTFLVTTDGGEVIPEGTRYRVRVIDPVGRESPAVDHVLKPKEPS